MCSGRERDSPTSPNTFFFLFSLRIRVGEVLQYYNYYVKLTPMSEMEVGCPGARGWYRQPKPR